MAAGEWVMMDVCPRVDGYAGDISRHRVAGDVNDLDPRLRKMYDVALQMSEEVRNAIRPGVTGRELNSLAEQIADAAGDTSLRRTAREVARSMRRGVVAYSAELD